MSNNSLYCADTETFEYFKILIYFTQIYYTPVFFFQISRPICVKLSILYLFVKERSVIAIYKEHIVLLSLHWLCLKNSLKFINLLKAA